MENKLMRFLSLMLALVMVIGLMPVGQVRAAEEAITINVGKTHEVTLDGNHSINVTDNEYVKVTSVFVPEKTEPVQVMASQVTSVEAGEYIIVNTRDRYVMTNEPNSGNTQLKFKGTTMDRYDSAMLWTITPVYNSDDTLKGYYVQDSRGWYLTTKGKVALEKFDNEEDISDDYVLTIATSVFGGTPNAFKIGLLDANGQTGSNFLNNYQGKNGWVDLYDGNDVGSQWRLFKVETVYTNTMSPDEVTHGYLKNNTDYVIASTNDYYRRDYGHTGAFTLLKNTAANNNSRLPTSNKGANKITNVAADEIWTLVIDQTTGNVEDNTLEITGKLQRADGQCLTYADNIVTVGTDKPVLIKQGTPEKPELPTNSGWGIRLDENDGHYLNNSPGGVWDLDDGGLWSFYEVIKVPVGTTKVTIEALKVGETEITIGDTTYDIEVTMPELEVTARYTSNRLSWDAVEGVSYSLEYKTEENGEWRAVEDPVASGTCIHDTGSAGTQYSYRLKIGGNVGEAVQGVVTGMDALLASAAHYKVYEDGLVINNGLNANGVKEIFAQGDAVANKLNVLQEGTIIYKANNNTLDNKQAVLGTDNGRYVGTNGSLFRHELSNGLQGEPRDNAALTKGIDYSAALIYTDNHWAMAHSGACKYSDNTSRTLNLLSDSGANTYYVGCAGDEKQFSGTIYWIIVTGEVLTDNEIAAVTRVVNVSNVTLSASEQSLVVGENTTLTATTNGENQNVIWSTSNADVATVENGVVTAVAYGDAVITATSQDGALTATCTVHVHTPGAPMYDKVESGYTETVSCSVCGTVMSRNNVDKFGISYTNITLDNDLKVNFAFEKTLVSDLTDCYAVVEKNEERKEIPMDKWATTGIKGESYYYVTFDGVAAKEMTDEFSVTIYNAQNQPISTVYTDSIKAYAHRVLNSNEYKDEYKTVMVDMLNYGAEAQETFNYKTTNKANANLTEEQSGFATKDASFDNDLVKTGNIEYLANVKLESNIQFMMAFTGIDPDTMTATVTFTSWNNVEYTIDVDSDDFVKGGSYHYITIEETVIADGRRPITCTIMEGEKVIATVTDSIASYAARAAEKNSDNADLYQAMMKFSVSAYEYLK